MKKAARSARIHTPEIREYFERKTAQGKYILYFTSFHASVRKGNAANPKVLRDEINAPGE